MQEQLRRLVVKAETRQAAQAVGGAWHKALEVPGIAVLNKGGQAHIISVSCASAGHCSAGGTYVDSSGVVQAFVASQT